MSVSEEEVRHVAGLARLRLDDDEAGELASELSGILEHVEELRTAPVEGANGGDDTDPLTSEPKTRPGDGEPDTMERSPAELAPEWRDGFFVLPRLAALDRAPGGEEEDG